MKILLCGATGLLGSAILKQAAHRPEIEVIALARKGVEANCDLTNYNQLETLFGQLTPDVVINAAANVDHAACESDPGAAYAVNARAVAFLAGLCRSADAYLLHVSTDHYYRGDGDLKHSEGAAVVLLNEYARTKYAGEAFALTVARSCVIRTNVVGFRNWEKPTFVEWVVQTLEKGESLTAFHDYYTSSLDAGTLAGALLNLAAIRSAGLLNVASSEVASKEKFIRSLADRLGFNQKLIKTGSLKDSALVPKRADSLGLDVSNAEKILGRLPGLDQVIDNLVTEYQERKQ